MIVVYGDREHAANIHWLTGFDPRFEEAVLVITPGDALLLAGNECLAYTAVSPVVRHVDVVARSRHVVQPNLNLHVVGLNALEAAGLIGAGRAASCTHCDTEMNPLVPATKSAGPFDDSKRARTLS